MAASSKNSTDPYDSVPIIGGGSLEWDNIIDISGVFKWSEVTLSSGDFSDYVVATNFGFDIPLLATIDGIVVSLEKVVSTNLGFSDYRAYLFESGNQIDTTISGSRHLGSGWPVAAETFTYGSPTDKWNINPTPIMVNGSTFGFGLSAEFGSASGTFHTGEVGPTMEMTVYYTVDGLKFGTTSIVRIYIGTNEIQRVYKADVEIT